MLRFGTALAQGGEVLKHYITHHDHGANWGTDLLMQEIMTSTDLLVNGIVQVKMPVLVKGRFCSSRRRRVRGWTYRERNQSCVGRRVLVSCED